jgi:hypothetical protein
VHLDRRVGDLLGSRRRSGLGIAALGQALGSASAAHDANDVSTRALGVEQHLGAAVRDKPGRRRPACRTACALDVLGRHVERRLGDATSSAAITISARSIAQARRPRAPRRRPRDGHAAGRAGRIDRVERLDLGVLAATTVAVSSSISTITCASRR